MLPLTFDKTGDWLRTTRDFRCRMTNLIVRNATVRWRADNNNDDEVDNQPAKICLLISGKSITFD